MTTRVHAVKDEQFNQNSQQYKNMNDRPSFPSYLISCSAATTPVPRTRSQAGAERIRQDKRRLSRPLNTCFIRSSPADVKQNKHTLKTCRRQEKQTLESMSPQNSKHYQLPFRNDANFANHPGAADMKVQPKSHEFLLKMQIFRNFSLVSLGIRPRSRRGAERIRQGEGRLGGPPKTALERRFAGADAEPFLKNKGSAWAPAFAGAHASGRAGQHFDNLRCSCPIWHALNFRAMPRV